MRLIKKIARAFIRETACSNPQVSIDQPSRSLSANTLEIWDSVRPFTMTSLERVAALCDSIDYIVRNGIAGQIVECGVWKGGSAMAAMLRLKQNGEISREFALFDTFEGMTLPGEHDRDLKGVSAEQQLAAGPPESNLVWCRSHLDEVLHNISLTGYDKGLISCIKGNVLETIPREGQEEIALLRLDTDFYDSTLHELRHLYHHVAPGGVVIIDDYGHWRGCQKAVDEFFEAEPFRPLMHSIDYTGRIFVKPN